MSRGKWLRTMLIVSPLSRVVGPHPFQIGVSWLKDGGYQPLTNWDDPPRRSRLMVSLLRLTETFYKRSMPAV